ncbi:MAG: O-antigen ligase family protein [Flavobacteriaceae bacterium]|nr:O-antigen ligase family protein [Flavobacteriaceae bacterium]
MISILLTLLIIGVFSSFFYQNHLFNKVKDLLYFSKPIIDITLGYLLVKRINDKNFFLKTVIYISLIFALFHISSVLLNTNFSTDSVNDIRNTNGLANPLELLALIIIIISYRFDFFRVIKKRKGFILFIISLSILFYFSRTMLVAFILMVFAVFGYAKLTAKGLKYGMIAISLVGLFYFYLFSIDLKRDEPGLESFFYKMKIAPSEIFFTKKEIDIKNHKNLWDYWRAYEANMAYQQMKLRPISFINGFGFGSLVDLKFVASLNEKGMRYIPILHNGYSFVLFKTGLLGLIFYLYFLFSLYFQSYKKKISKDEMLIRNFISAIGLYFIFTSFIITGIYNLEVIYTFILGGFLFLLSKTTTNPLNKNN